VLPPKQKPATAAGYGNCNITRITYGIKPFIPMVRAGGGRGFFRNTILSTGLE